MPSEDNKKLDPQVVSPSLTLIDEIARSQHAALLSGSPMDSIETMVKMHNTKLIDSADKANERFIIKESNNSSFETLLYHLLGSSTIKEKCEQLKNFMKVNEHNEFLRPNNAIYIIFSREIGITRKEFINWLINQKDCNYYKWNQVIGLFLESGFPEVRELLSSIVKSQHTPSAYRSRVTAIQLVYLDHNDSKYLIDNPLPSDFSPEPKLKIKSRKLRVAFLSEKFATNYMSSQNTYQDAIFSGSPDDVEIYLFSLASHPDEYTKPYRERPHQFINLFGLSDEECLSAIEKADIDIVVDLFGITPIKYWKFFKNSIRVLAMDGHCFIKDYYHYTLEAEGNFSAWKKNFITLSPVPNQLFLPSPHPVRINRNAPSVTNKYITFGVFSRLLKIHPINYDTWTTLLSEVPKSIIAFSFIQLDSPLQYIISIEFKRRGVSLDRIRFFPRTDPENHLTKYNTVDVVLDTFPVGSGFSALDALWMGVPLIGLSRETDTVTTTIMIYKMLGKESWATKNEREYIDVCKKIALDESYRKELKFTLRPATLKSDLMNGKKWSQAMYKNLKQIAIDNRQANRSWWSKWIA